MVWTAAGRPDFVADVQAMRRRVEEHVRPDHADRELKLGRGGLRDVEFAVQLLQLVHGRADPALRSPTTLDALAALASGGYVGRDDGANLAASYRFLRLLEHRLQLHRMRRTHLLPAEDDTDALRWLARSAKLRADGRHDAVGVLLEEWRRNARRVRRLHEKLFYRPLLDAASRVPAAGLSAEAATVRLGALGWVSPEGALHHLRALTGGVSRAASIQKALLPVLLDELARTPDPDRGLLAYRRVSEALATTPWYLRLLRDEGLVAERLMRLLGTSALVPDLLVRAPEVLRLLAAPVTGQRDELIRDPANAAATLRTAVGRQPDPHAAATTARSARRHEMLRIACADLLGKMDVEQVCSGLSAVWAAVLQGVLASALRALGGATPPARLAVIAMGRLGGSELGYGSDADVLFVCEPLDGASDHEAAKFATTVVETVRRQLGSASPDPALVIDADLRPEGRSGPLVRTLTSYREYYARWSEAWEAQALLRARPVAGDADLGRRFIELIDPIRYPDDGLSPAAVTEIRRIKARVDAERLPRGADRATHTKLGHGGLADVEWTVQLLQLQHAGDIPELRTTATLEGLREAAEADLITHDDAEELAAGWMMATRARNAIMLVRGKPGDQLPRSGRELAAVATAMGYPAGRRPGRVPRRLPPGHPPRPRGGGAGVLRLVTRRRAAPVRTGSRSCTTIAAIVQRHDAAVVHACARTISRPNPRERPALGLPWRGAFRRAPPRLPARRRRARRDPRPERAVHRRPRPRARPPRGAHQRRRQHDRRRADRPRRRAGDRGRRRGLGRRLRRAQVRSARPTWSTSACRPGGTAATSPSRSVAPVPRPAAGSSGRACSSARRTRRCSCCSWPCCRSSPTPAPGSPATQMLVLGLLFTVIAATLDSVWGLAAGSARDWFATSPARLRRVGGAGGLMMIGLGTTLALTGRRD